jgi:hypothetical protein
MIISSYFILRMKNVSDEICRENQNTHFTSNNFFFLKSCRLWDNVEKLFRVRQATDDNMAHAHCILDNQGYKFTRRIRNIYWFSTATMFARTHLNIALYVHCTSLFFFVHISNRYPKVSWHALKSSCSSYIHNFWHKKTVPHTVGLFVCTFYNIPDLPNCRGHKFTLK